MPDFQRTLCSKFYPNPSSFIIFEWKELYSENDCEVLEFSHGCSLNRAANERAVGSGATWGGNVSRHRNMHWFNCASMCSLFVISSIWKICILILTTSTGRSSSSSMFMILLSSCYYIALRCWQTPDLAKMLSAVPQLRFESHFWIRRICTSSGTVEIGQDSGEQSRWWPYFDQTFAVHYFHHAVYHQKVW